MIENDHRRGYVLWEYEAGFSVSSRDVHITNNAFRSLCMINPLSMSPNDRIKHGDHLVPNQSEPLESKSMA